MIVLLAFATEMEAAATCRRIGMGPGEGLVGKICLTLEPVVLGMGCFKPLEFLMSGRSGYSEIWNYGFAGALSDRHRVGDVLTVGSVSKNLSFPNVIDDHSVDFAERLYPEIQLEDNGERLLTSDYPIHRRQQRDALAEDWDLVDMEGYAIAWAAQQQGRACRIRKVVSDFADGGGKSDIQTHAEHFSELLADAVMADVEARVDEWNAYCAEEPDLDLDLPF